MVGMVSSCGACKFLRRKCEDVCIFGPYFSYDKAEVHFAAVHKVFGASNVSKLLSHLPTYQRGAAAITVTYEAQARLRDPVRGCVSYILALQHQVASLQEAIDCLAANLSNDSTTYQSAGCLSPQPTMGSLDKFHLGEQQYCMVGDAHSSAFGNVETQPVYKEAIDLLEQCLFFEEPSLWEELSMTSLNQDLLC